MLARFSPVAFPKMLIPKMSVNSSVSMFYTKENLKFSSKYFDPNRPNLHSISMDLGLGDLLDSSLAKCSAENLANNIFDVKSLKNSDLKDKSGKKVGNIRICQDNEQEAENFYIEMTNGEVSFFIRTNNLKGETEKNEPLKFNEIVEFVREIPFNTNVIFENLP